MPWQLLSLAGITAFDSSSARWWHRQALVTVARQNGKSTELEALVEWWLTDYAAEVGAQVVTLTSHDLRLTSIMFARIAADLERAGELVGKPRWSHGRQDLHTRAGGSLYVQTGAASAGHGLSVDLAVVDELWDVPDDAVDQGLIPAQRARPNPLLVMASTAGIESSTLMRRWREHGLRSIDAGGGRDGIYFAEWSPPPGVDPMAESSWRWANPALGTTITLATLRSEAANPNRSAFLRASLNLWQAGLGTWLEPGLWEACSRAGAELPAGGVLACETSQDGSQWVGVRAAVDVDGAVGVAVELVADDEPAFWRLVVEAVEANPGLVVACTPGLDGRRPPGVDGPIVGFAELRKWTAVARSAIRAGNVWHVGQLSLAEHVARAVAAHMDGGIALSSAKSRGPIELARCAVWAIALASAPAPAVPPAPMIVTA